MNEYISVSAPIKTTFSELDSFAKQNKHSRETIEAFYEEALKEGIPAVQKQAFQSLCLKGGTKSIRRILRHYDQLPSSLQEELSQHIPKWSSIARKIVENEHLPEAVHLLECIAKSNEVKSASIALTCILSSKRRMRRRGVQALIEITKNVLQLLKNQSTNASEGDPPVQSSDLWQLSSTYMEALPQYDQIRNQEFLKGLISLGESSYAAVSGILSNPSHPAHEDLQDTLSSCSGNGILDILLRLTGEEDADLSSFAKEQFEERTPDQLANMLFTHLHTYSHKNRFSIVLLGDEWKWLQQVYPKLPGTSTETARLCLRFLRDLNRQVSQNIDVLEGFSLLLQHESTDIQKSAIQEILKLENDRASDQLEHWIRESQPDSLKTIVQDTENFLSMSQRRRFLRIVMDTGSEELQKLAGQVLAEELFTRYMDEYDEMNEKTRKTTGETLKEIDPNLMDRIAEELQSLDSERKIRALKVLEHSETSDLVKSLLFKLVNDEDQRVRATVVKALGVLGSRKAMEALIEFLSDPDRRVRSNAMEAIEEIGNKRFSKLLIPYLEDDDNRVRSTAAKVLWNLGFEESDRALKNMLKNDRADMRISAIWAIGEIEHPEAYTLLAQVIEQDPNPDVRKKARDVLQDLLQKEHSS